MRPADIDHRYKYHPSNTPTAINAHETVRGGALAFAHLLNTHVPDGADKHLALDALDEVLFRANAGIARGGRPHPETCRCTPASRPRPVAGRRRRTPMAEPQTPTPLPPRTTPWNGTLNDAADIILRARIAGHTGRYLCVDASACLDNNGNTPHTIEITGLTGSATVLPGTQLPKVITDSSTPAL
ncbi:hypothetical protein KGD82_16420 [Nocardiopsis eucommiae]|uniref:Acb2/Tad1 hairpin domain-containing protein n=1 Tax=Nocardiopsis eucommiae TaxID=2831970 RepID=A0A975L773_9ACTN|nr:hypothetical protein KGD82_16420 [Nocardiopsis eucommiae]